MNKINVDTAFQSCSIVTESFHEKPSITHDNTILANRIVVTVIEAHHIKSV